MAARAIAAAFVVSGIGSLAGACLRYAGVDEPEVLAGDLEIVSLAGSLSADGAHLHAALSTSEGRLLGGHVAPGCIVRTTVELLLAVLPEHRFSREIDPSTGYPELVIARTPTPTRD